jgi:hypothetical protein
MTKRAFTCSQCGAPDLEAAGEGKVRCPYCGSLYRYAVAGPTVVVAESADVVFGRGATVIIKGGLQIGEHARVQVDGELILEERAPTEVVQAAKLRLLKPT